jgi:endonuclease/exonuclease/phosphatase family metal-dependent hydrolase
MRIKQGIKWIAVIILVFIGFTIGWYLVVRLASPWNAVKLITLNEKFSSNQADVKQELRVGCYNIAHGRGGRLSTKSWEGGDRATKIHRVKQIGRILKDAQIDIVVLNEVDFSSFWSGHFDQARVIAQEAGYSYFAEQRNVDIAIPFCSIRFGNAILSRYPISEAKFIKFPNPSRIQELFGGDTKYGLLCTIDLPGGDSIRVFAVHLTVHSEALRAECARIILRIQAESDIPLIAMGDFNSTPIGYPDSRSDKSGNNAIDLLFKSSLFATIPMGIPPNSKDFTFPSEKPSLVIDWIFVSSPWKITEKEVLSSELSDHLPVVARLSR